MQRTEYRSALVLGLGKSGMAAASLLLDEGASVSVVDRADTEELISRAKMLRQRGAKVTLAADDSRPLDNGIGGLGCDVCVVSPGISTTSAWVKDVRARGIEVVSELGLAAARCTVPMIAITGSNGKSTAAKLCAESLCRSGKKALIAGNYGLPLADVIREGKQNDWIVVEVSSFQLETTETFEPKVGLWLNLQPDHLDRHGSVEEYAKAKARLFCGMSPEGVAIVLDNDLDGVQELTRAGKHAHSGPGRWLTFGISEDADYRLTESYEIVFDGGHGQRQVKLADTPFQNEVMGLTAAGIVAVLDACGIDAAFVERTARNFEPLAHRMSLIAEVEGVKFIDDSKATNLSAMEAALRMIPGKALLIAGGLLKQKTMESTKVLLAKKVRKVYLIGDAATRMQEAWQDVVTCRLCSGLEDAVRLAWEDASGGECVLLSPGCASFDQFDNFEDRGKQFSNIARTIEKESAE